MSRSYFQQKGFTTIELMITLAVTAILLALAIPGFQGAIRKGAIATNTERLSASLNLARTKAISSRRNVHMCPSTNLTSCTNGSSWTNGWIIYVDEDGDGNLDSGELFQARGAMDSRISLTTPADFSTSVEFKPTGVVYGNGNPNKSGQFNFCSGDYHDLSHLVKISASGRVTSSKQADLCKEES